MNRKARPAWLPLVDFLMCWFALTGLGNVAVGVADLTKDVSLFAAGTTFHEKLGVFAEYGCGAIVGFVYMLWRYQWHCRLVTLAQITTFWCVMLAAAKAMDRKLEARTVVLVLGMGCVLVGYSIYWPSRIRKYEEGT